MLNNIRAFNRVVRRDGVRVAAKKVIRRLLAQTSGGLNSIPDPIKHYEFLLGEESGFGLKLTSENLDQSSITWLIPDFEAQSGGHINIFRMIQLLKDRGFPNQHVVIMEPYRWSSVEEAQAALSRSFGDYGITVSLGVRSIEPCAYLVATGWQTAYWVSKYKDTLHKLYFVQDFEPAFYSQGSDYYFAENTYRLGLTGITAGSWLADKLADEYGMKTFSYSFACDTELYKPGIRHENSTKQIFFYARPVTPRRCFEIGLLALRKVCEAMPNTSVVFAGWDVKGYHIPFPHVSHGGVSVAQLPNIYAQCDVALILSATNLSLLPLEVAACGCPVVLNDNPQSNWLLSNEEANYCELSVESIAATIVNVLKNPVEAKKKASAALAHSQNSSWENEADEVAKFLKTL
ncbi:glycosyltransferase family 4 protein [Phyllobacterium sp. 628]|uniref:rhamnosyltransferase WsaF family glycosyltransferase n=1 Tax=Phyllobacterium sp. 628 TaxID=2718938 RepID=UPI001662620E|nr:glycosyltransferase [Phyllobacterium sp. 628]QND52687.1 glycosyltransferase family 4 protein [Phyllobacterium sp. 628]